MYSCVWHKTVGLFERRYTRALYLRRINKDKRAICHRPDVESVRAVFHLSSIYSIYQPNSSGV